ncbi:uncharacterized protein E0L32_006432 [Thyridium curvatum]|uniref:Uncharacterized protein n=1 Tax=Thyridium curvatum TaxID=1093900 RepID=A0A507ATB0_9PEZI|nr:uncharacterized protein E0L32_006432 [Thyridium curvatum]TPX13232.1 hypothetical protein E0L32_006432 [Thyridium curvatum]
MISTAGSTKPSGPRFVPASVQDHRRRSSDKAPRSIWRHRDSSEKTVSTPGSPLSAFQRVRDDNGQGICLAAALSTCSLAPRTPCSASREDEELPEQPPSSRAASSLGTHNILKSRGDGSDQRSSSHRLSQENEVAPLQPLYLPPRRPPTPDGLPNYEQAQQEALARRRRQQAAQQTRLAAPTRATTLPGSRLRRLFESAPRPQPSRAAPPDPYQAPLWRPPASQHALPSHHPYLAAAAAAAQRPPGVPGGPRAVSLDDYAFLRQLDGRDAGCTGTTVDAQGRHHEPPRPGRGWCFCLPHA